MSKGWRILTHGGAGSDPESSDATRTAARVAREALQTGVDPLEAACHAVAHLEDDERFNAGTGSHLRADGRTVETDAACAASDDRWGAVACLEGVRHPVFVARHVADTEHILLAGEGARRFARSQGFANVDLSERANSATSSGRTETPDSDTVGCVLQHGDLFAAALSSGGTRDAMVGRVGDVPLPGCGLHAGPAGAVAATGHGETIARRRVADRAYQRLEDGHAPESVVDETVTTFPDKRAFGLIAVTRAGGAGASNRPMAWSRLEAEG